VRGQYADQQRRRPCPQLPFKYKRTENAFLQAEFEQVNLTGVTGGIAAGKSTVLAIIAELGQPILDSDTVVHQLYRDSDELRQLLVTQWGEQILTATNQIDRNVVAAKIFADDRQRQWLNEQLHPRVHRQVLAAAAAVAPQILFCAVPLLFEVQWQRFCRQTIAIWCTPEQQQQRLAHRGWTARQIEQRLAAQLSMDEKLARADFGLINTGSLDWLRQQCELLLQKIL